VLDQAFLEVCDHRLEAEVVEFFFAGDGLKEGMSTSSPVRRLSWVMPEVNDRLSGRMIFEDSRATPRSMIFSNSRTLPGKL